MMRIDIISPLPELVENTFKTSILKRAIEKKIVKILENENVAYDIGSYRSAPPGLRIWGGPTINPNDIKLLFPWLQWAFEDTYKLLKKGN